MKRILIITSCTGEKAVESDEQLTLDDFRQGGAHLKAREKSLAKLQMPAAELYTGQQHVRLMRGIEKVASDGKGKSPKVDLWVLSAGYGLVPGDRKLSPYETTFQGMKSKEIREWGDSLNIPTEFRELVEEKYDLCLVLLGDGYLSACNLDASVKFGGQTLLFCGTGMAKKLPRLANVRMVTLSNPEAKRFSCALVGLKGELAARLLNKLSTKELTVEQLRDPASDLLSALDSGESTTSSKSTSRKAAVANPNVDKVIQIPKSWWKSKHREKLRYFIPEWDDLVDPDYDFITDEHSGGASDWSNETYAHQMFPSPNYDGFLMSRVVAEKSQKKKARINELGVHRFLRAPRDFPIMGDCGAFGYINEKTPPYTTGEVLDYYTRLDFDFGVSVDHLIVTATEADKKFRYELTISNAEDFLREHRKRKLSWCPIGAVQGWDPKSYAAAAKQYVGMGYSYIGLGGLVRSSTKDILQILHAVHAVVPESVSIHLFGLARLNAINSFADLGVRSVDSASYLRQAWMRDSQGYLTPTGSYSAIRIPEIGKSFRAKRMLEESETSEAVAIKLEKKALESLRNFDSGDCSMKKCLDAVFAYEKLFGRDISKHEVNYERTLSEKPWKACPCPICTTSGIEVVIFRGNNRNRRRGFHNTFVFYELIKDKLIHGEPVPSSKQLLLFEDEVATP
jgi:hypothetical protein